MRYHRTTGLQDWQMRELTGRVGQALVEPWQKVTGPRKCPLFQAVQIACMYIRQNITQEVLGDLWDVSQPTVSRIVQVVTPLVKTVLAEFVPTPEEAIEVVDGRVCLVDGTITPCWSYEDHPELWSRKHGTTGFNAQLLCLLDGTPVYISDPLPGRTHDATAVTATDIADIVSRAGGTIADKGYQGCEDMITPRKKPRNGKLSKGDEQNNSHISSLRAAVERFVAHFKNWRIFYTDYRRPFGTYKDTFDAARGLFFFSITPELE